MNNNKEQKEIVFQNAIAHWWESKKVNAKSIDKPQGGERDQNLRGDTMDGFRTVILKHLLDYGVRREDIFYGGQLDTFASNLPSFYRASKNWDMVICKNSHYKRLKDPSIGEPVLIAAIEFKSQNKSIGNNQNNRIEESIGNAYDFWESYENRNFIHLKPRPWLGYLFVGRYGDGDETTPVEITQPHIPSDPAFIPKVSEDLNAPLFIGMNPEKPQSRLSAVKIDGVSYAQRYRIFLERMVAKKLYDGACFLVTHEDIAQSEPNYRVLFSELSGNEFLDSLRRHMRGYYFD